MTKYSNGDVVSYSECGDQGKVVGHTDSGRVLVDYGSGHIVAESPDFLILVSPAVEQQDDTGKYVLVDGLGGQWLAEAVGHHTCGTARGGYYGHHEPGCGLEPIGLVDDLLRKASPAAQSQGVEAWCVAAYDGTIVSLDVTELQARSRFGGTPQIVRGRFVPVDEPGEPEDTVTDADALLDRIWDLAAGDTPEMKRPELGYEQAMYEIRKLFPIAAAVRAHYEGGTGK